MADGLNSMSVEQYHCLSVVYWKNANDESDAPPSM